MSRSVQTEMEIRVAYPDQPGTLAFILKTIREAGGALKAHLVFRRDAQPVGLFVCEKPTEAAVALKSLGFEVTTETVVTVETESGAGAVSHLVRTLEVEGIALGYSYSTSAGETLCVVLRTDDNPKAEDVLRNYLLCADD